MNFKSSPRVARVCFSLVILFVLLASFTVETAARGKHPRGRAARRSEARGGKLSKRERREEARANRRGGRVRLSKREMRAERQRDARDQAAAIAKLEKRSGHKLSKRERAAEMRRSGSRRRREIEEARRRAEAARQAAIARQRAIDEGLRNEVQANIGRDNTVGEDLEVRNAAIAALGHHAGTVVVMDPKSGRIYTVVNQEWALRRGFKPCSTIKLVTGVAGLCEKVIQPIETVSDGSNYRIDLTDALAYSNNSYFQHVGGQVGFEKMVTYARELGLGEKTGINYVNESPGKVPLFKSGYAVNHMSSHGDDFEVTAIQLASLVSAMSNGGKLLTPHVPRTVEENSQFKTEVRRKINVVDNEAWKRMVPGMIGAVNYGSGKKAYRPEQTVAGKTGTCIGQGSWLGLFTSYAPVVNPRLAVVVITRGADAHGHLPAAVAGNIYRALSTRFGTQINFQIAEGADDEATPTNGRDKKAAALNEEAKETKAATEAEENSDDAAATTNTGTAKSNVETAPANEKSKVKVTSMPIENKPKAPAKAGANDLKDGRPRRTQPNQQ
ncbi:MAG: penicillin-binding protein 2 [Blastocatellia bacterium]|jgi:membrane peptidoglycan carboxypeptidase|nr:penicillin-binding protein 2 [Blastocatellia bacterium]